MRLLLHRLWPIYLLDSKSAVQTIVANKYTNILAIREARIAMKQLNGLGKVICFQWDPLYVKMARNEIGCPCEEQDHSTSQKTRNLETGGKLIWGRT